MVSAVITSLARHAVSQPRARQCPVSRGSVTGGGTLPAPPLAASAAAASSGVISPARILGTSWAGGSSSRCSGE